MGDILSQIGESLQSYAPNILAAIIVLVVGWIVALIVAAVVRGALRRTGLSKKLADSLSTIEKVTAPDLERKVGKGFFYLILILVFVAFFQVLGLTLAVDPLNQLLKQVFEFLPRIVGAGILVAIAWIVATLMKMVIIKALTAVKFDERLGEKLDKKEGEGEKTSLSMTKTVAEAVYWIIFLIFLPSILGALGLIGLLGPVQGMIDEVLGFLPNILIASLVILVGWFVARILRKIVTNLLTALGLNQLGDRIGIGKALGEQGLSGLIGLIVYIFILIPVMLTALNALNIEAITQPVSDMLNIMLSAIPSIFAAAIVLIIAFIIGRVVAGLVTNLLTGVGFDGLITRIGLMKESAEGKNTPSKVVGTLIVVGIMLFAAIAASDMLGFEPISDLSSEFMVLAGHILLGLLILGVGIYLSTVATKAIRSSKTPQAGFLAWVARIAILMLVGAMGLRQMGLANEIITLAFGLLLGSLAVAVAIAFGIGGRDMAAKKLEKWSSSMESKDSE